MKPAFFGDGRSLLSVASVLAARVAGAAAGFFALALVARLLSPAETGTFLLMQSAVSLAALFALGNLDGAAIRILPGAEETRPGTTHLFLKTLSQTAMIGVPLAFIAVSLGLWLTTPLTLIGALWAGCGLLGFVALRSSARVARALGEVRISSAMQLAGRPILFFLCLSVTAAIVLMDLSAAVAAFALAAMIAGLGHMTITAKRLHRRLRSPPFAGEIRPWRMTGLALLITVLLTEEYPNTVLFIANFALDEAALGELGVALRLALLVKMVPASVLMAFGPQVVAALKRNGPTAASPIALTVTRISATVTAAAALGMALCAVPLLGLFGETYSADPLPLFTLLTVPIANAVFGPNLLILATAGKNRRLVTLTLLNLAIMTIAVLTVAPHGLLAISIVIAVAFVLWEVTLYLAARETTGINAWLPRALAPLPRAEQPPKTEAAPEAAHRTSQLPSGS